jgi:3-methylfumaryl-CoA hydratase
LITDFFEMSRMNTPATEELEAWIGRTESRADAVTAWPAVALAATLDRRDPAPGPGDALPPGWHWLYFLEAAPASELGPDGHPKRGGFLPPVALPRRMWAGGRLEFRRALRVGESIRRDATLSIEPKQGRSGNLVFVTVRHSVSAGGELAVIEDHDIVYREAAKSGDAPPPPKPAPREASWRRELVADPVMLFRYSALTFIGQRIHYDLEYCRNVEGYPGLVVHGPLQVILLLDLARRNEPRPVRRIEYRALHPLFHFERFTVNGNPAPDGAQAQLWTANSAGNQALAATAYL